jgi:protein-disulfide isomerase
MTCHHCADFHKQTLPQLKKDYIDTGKVQYILRDMPWDNMALAASKLARCASPENYYLVVDAIMGSQGKWITAKDPLAELKMLARMGGGLKDEQMDTCLKDADLHQRLIAGQRLAQDALGVKSTPTFFVGADMIEGAQSYDVLKTAIEKKLSAVKK